MPLAAWVLSRRRRALAMAVLGMAAPLAASAGAGAQDVSPAVPELPAGGRLVFPDYRVVAYAGNPHAPGLGALGIGTPDQAIRRLKAQARGYALPRRPVLPALELIVTIAQRFPGDGFLYRGHAPHSMIVRYLAAARRARALLLLGIQPGRSDFVSEVRRLRRWLVQPDVGVALDPEWRLGPGQVPGYTLGSVGSVEVNRVSAELATIVRRYDLPEKVLVLHQFTRSMLADKHRIRRRRGVATVINLDSMGDARGKAATYRRLASRQARFRNGIKLFYREDFGLMSPSTIMALRPRPDFVVYE